MITYVHSVFTCTHVCSRIPQSFTELIINVLDSIQLLHCIFRLVSVRESSAKDVLSRAYVNLSSEREEAQAYRYTLICCSILVYDSDYE
jgi:hypothetical protein